MCFAEFIGYTCGHSSAEVLRPCPMTTQLHTNPLCARYARRPVLAPEMCPACQRVLHGRAVLITEWEHRWMHERGVCGCEVQFPDLFRPRVAGRENGAPHQGAGGGGVGGGGGGAGNGRSGGGSSSVAKMSLPRMVGGNNKAGAKNVPALYQETVAAAVGGGGGKPGVAVRIPSFYGAEWVDEHRQLHIRGSCKCLGDFSFYQTPASYRAVPSSSVQDSREQVVQIAGSRPSQRRLSRNSTVSHYLNQPRTFDTRLSRPANSDYSHFQRVTSNQGNLASRHVHPNQMGINKTQLQRNSTSNVTGANVSAPDFLGHSLGQGADTTAPFMPQRSAGAIHVVDPARSTNQLYNYACGEGAKITSCADFPSVEFPKPEGVLPLVGLPIGAGPEGPAGLPHTGDFAYCVLHMNDLLASLGEPRLLKFKSRSFSCLNELKRTKQLHNRAADTQSATSAESSPSQSVCSSAEVSDNENEFSGDNRL